MIFTMSSRKSSFIQTSFIQTNH